MPDLYRVSNSCSKYIYGVQKSQYRDVSGQNINTIYLLAIDVPGYGCDFYPVKSGYVGQLCRFGHGLRAIHSHGEEVWQTTRVLGFDSGYVGDIILVGRNEEFNRALSHQSIARIGWCDE
jgi:hypothetical protein